MKLDHLFEAIAAKKLAPVDLPSHGSNQHEINGVAALREFFGVSTRTQYEIIWHYFSGTEETVRVETNTVTFYDARENHSTRTEWRLFYSGSFIEHATPGDVLILARTKTTLFGLIFDIESEWFRAASVLFGVPDDIVQTTNFIEHLKERELDFVAEQIISTLGLEIQLPTSASDEDLVTERFGETFPTTQAMSTFALEQSTGMIDLQDPDNALVYLLKREEELFRALEKIIVEERLQRGFSSVDDFIAYSLQVHNRRKSRMGYALENHLRHLFATHHLIFQYNARTEGRKKPDFLFPGSEEYHDETFPTQKLFMLGAKSSCKDRWRQVLSEANRIEHKHLCTLEQSISENQTEEMKNSKLQLVIPHSLHQTFTPQQRHYLWTLSQFVDHVKRVQQSG